MSPHVQQEIAEVWTGGGRRYFTRKAAMRGAAKKIIRDYLRGTGDEQPDTPTFQAWVALWKGGYCLAPPLLHSG